MSEQDNNEKIGSLMQGLKGVENDVKKLEERVFNMSQTTAVAVSQFEEIKSSLRTIREVVDELKEFQNTMINSLGSVKRNQKTNEENFDDIKNSISKMSDTVQVIKDKIKDVENLVSTVEETVGAHQDYIKKRTEQRLDEWVLGNRESGNRKTEFRLSLWAQIISGILILIISVSLTVIVSRLGCQ